MKKFKFTSSISLTVDTRTLRVVTVLNAGSCRSI